MGYSVVLLDDDVTILTVNARYLTKAGNRVITFSDPVEALSRIPKMNPDIIVSDRMMPGMDGMTFCQKLHQLTDIPLIFLTGKVSEDDRVEGLLNGADDYIIKPYSLKELDARIRVVLKRRTKKEQNVIQYPPLELHLIEHKVLYKGEEIPLAKREYELFTLLATSPDTLFTFGDIGRALPGSYLESDRSSIMVYASRLRKKLELYSGTNNMIETVRSKGYRFIKPH